jgi:hypothetical protein
MGVAAVVTSESEENDRLEMLRINVRHWRKESGLAFRYMPVSLWQDVTAAARKYGVARVACVVGVNLEDLKKRVGHCDPEPAPALPPMASEPQFIELPGVLPPDPPPAPAPTSCPTVAPSEAPAPRAADEAWIEVVACDGAKLTLRLPVSSLSMAAALVRDFRSRAA